jgi:hypothetical protein
VSKQSVTDPTAGERARQIRLDPARPQPILDPTDPRYGTSLPGVGSDEPVVTEVVEAERPERP